MITTALILATMLQLTPRAAWENTYRDTARAIAAAANDDPDPADAAALLVAVAKFESDFKPDAVGDNGDARGAWQIHPDAWRLDPSLFVAGGIEVQARAALALIRHSMDRCGDLTEYASGTCRRGTLKASHRLDLADRIRRAYRGDARVSHFAVSSSE
jgi:hypothetical protein